MRLLFIRHGEPDYVRDCLTDEGKKQAAAVAERLASEGISRIYSSPCGRAKQTASYTAKRLDLPVAILEYMREITWGGPGVPEGGHPWTLGDGMMAEGYDFRANDWRDHPYFRNNAATQCYHSIADHIDRFLAASGYRHEGLRFFCAAGTEETVALFSHGGSGACALAHLLALPFPYMCSVLPYDLTSVIALHFPVKEGAFVFPRVELFNDCAHLHSSPRDLTFC